MNRDELVALGRAAVTIAGGVAILYAIGSWLGWLAIAAIAAMAIFDWVWCQWQLPPRWRLW